MPRKRSDGRYELKVRVNKPGEPRKYKAVYGATLREAQEKKRELETEISAGIEAAKKPTVTALVEYWLSLRTAELRPQTIVNYRHALSHVTKLIGDTVAKTVTVDIARNTISTITNEVSANQGQRARKMICMVWDDAIARSVVVSNPWRFVPVPKYKAAEKRYLTTDELEKLEKAQLIPADRALVCLLRYTGVRVGEATALQVKDINFRKKLVNISKTNVDGVLFPPKTKAGARSVPMPKALVDTLRDYIHNYTPDTPDTFLFSSDGSSPWTKASIWRHFENIERLAFGENPDFTPHVFRHTYTHDLVANNVPPLTAQVLLGHSSYAITLNVYAHFGWKDIDADSVTKIFEK